MIKEKYKFTNITLYWKGRRTSFVNEKENHKDKYNEEKQEKDVKEGQQEMVKQNYLLSCSFVALSLLVAVSDNRKLPLSIHMIGQFQPKNVLGLLYFPKYDLFDIW